ncbi:hypothetical protein GIB67_028859 [Kingdonia uniflora]|uniref:DUF538 family protein n=1 Tax=Kingdonia uniflora TaxID=39325 RepID=A0A7J7LTK5_9MAGN|nr:hypothetical protein GIB67_001902 [Kingdonia uniflora]KAF6145864.1 hypothetical protein GIB67_028859 [Kingdonia uniflora]
MVAVVAVLLFFTTVVISASAKDVAVVAEQQSATIYQILQSHGLPMGLLPKGIKEFSLDDNGRFEVHLSQACDAKFENIMRYDRNVSGILSYGQMGSLSGIQSQELFIWLPVNGIKVDIPSSGLIYFDVGVIFKQFSLSLFESPPDCTPFNLREENPIADKSYGEKYSDEVHDVFDIKLKP